MNDNNGNTYKLLLMFVNIIQGNVQRDTIQKNVYIFLFPVKREYSNLFFSPYFDTCSVSISITFMLLRITCFITCNAPTHF